MSENGNVGVEIRDGIGTVTFSHPKSNSLPGALLAKLAHEITTLGGDESARVIVLQSTGHKAFCAGASFDEFRAIKDEKTGKEFFMGFMRVILAIKKCPKFVIARVHGKAVGGALGLISACDYTLAHRDASVKLSELSIGIGPFVIASVVERRLGFAAYSALTIDTEWRDASWAMDNGLFVNVFDTIEELDGAVGKLARKLSGFNPEGMAEMKAIFWEGTEHYDRLLKSRAETCGRLVLSEFTRKALSEFGEK